MQYSEKFWYAFVHNTVNCPYFASIATWTTWVVKYSSKSREWNWTHWVLLTNQSYCKSIAIATRISLVVSLSLDTVSPTLSLLLNILVIDETWVWNASVLLGALQSYIFHCPGICPNHRVSVSSGAGVKDSSLWGCANLKKKKNYDIPPMTVKKYVCHM